MRGTEGARDVARRASATADGPTFFACDPPDEVKPPPVSEEEAKLRNACKVGVSDKLQVVDEVELKVICQSAVERKLKSPKSAKFPGVFDNDAFAK